ncbi:MAG TPA: hypothetical protein VMW83_12715 [Spirochaetia bacterium]|nr:hypothetical protein [Spirochaetia bacterium]
MAIEKIFDEILKLPRSERDKLHRMLEKQESTDEATQAFEKAAGSWADFDADAFVEEIYQRRRLGTGRKNPPW